MSPDKKKILITIDWFLPGYTSGGPVRSIANMVEQLNEFSFYILTRNTDYCSTETYTNVDHNTWVKHSENTMVYYLSEEKSTKARFKNIILKIAPDVMYINGIYSKQFSIWPLELANKHRLKHIVAVRGMLSPHALAVKTLKKRVFLDLMNLKRAYRHTTFHATHADEAEHIKKRIYGYKDISVIPNLPRPVKSESLNFIKKETGKSKLIYLGRIAKEKGTLTAIEALKQCSGELQLDIYGTIYDQSYWKQCKEVIHRLPERIKVVYKGNLNSEEALTTIQKYHALLLYSSGENYGHAIVESFIARRPVIISKSTPWKNLEKRQLGFDVHEKDLPKAIQQLVDCSQEEFNTICEAIDDQIEDLLDINTNLKKYKNMFYLC